MRVMRALREMGIRPVAVYSEADRKALHVRHAEEAYAIGPAPAVESYLSIERILDAAQKAGADAIHPGYGFLSENPDFARACQSAGFVFIGPSPRAMELIGSKTAARRVASDAGVPVVPGIDRPLGSVDEAKRTARELGFPVMLKAAAGGGGKGLRLVRSEEEIESAFRTARSEAQNAFNDPALYLEKAVEQPRHIEIQVLGDAQGHMIHLGERECSLQRRHQKVMEEAPSAFLNDATRQRLGSLAVRLAQAAGYTNAGTVEFLADRKGSFYFLEMNARLQVEHPVTELVLGVDLVKAQIGIAQGERLTLTQENIRPRGWAMECRIYAEDPDHDFLPCPGLIRRLNVPDGPGVRNDSGVFEGWTVPLDYDPLLAKLVVWGRDREEARMRMQRALGEYEIGGIVTNLSFFRRVLDHPAFSSGEFDTGFIDRLLAEGPAKENGTLKEAERAAVVAAAIEKARTAHQAFASLSGPPASAWKAAGRHALMNNRPGTGG